MLSCSITEAELLEKGDKMEDKIEEKSNNKDGIRVFPNGLLYLLIYVFAFVATVSVIMVKSGIQYGVYNTLENDQINKLKDYEKYVADRSGEYDDIISNYVNEMLKNAIIDGIDNTNLDNFVVNFNALDKNNDGIIDANDIKNDLNTGFKNYISQLDYSDGQLFSGADLNYVNIVVEYSDGIKANLFTNTRNLEDYNGDYEKKQITVPLSEKSYIIKEFNSEEDLTSYCNKIENDCEVEPYYSNGRYYLLIHNYVANNSESTVTAYIDVYIQKNTAFIEEQNRKISNLGTWYDYSQILIIILSVSLLLIASLGIITMVYAGRGKDNKAGRYTGIDKLWLEIDLLLFIVIAAGIEEMYVDIINYVYNTDNFTSFDYILYNPRTFAISGITGILVMGGLVTINNILVKFKARKASEASVIVRSIIYLFGKEKKDEEGNVIACGKVNKSAKRIVKELPYKGRLTLIFLGLTVVEIILVVSFAYCFSQNMEGSALIGAFLVKCFEVYLFYNFFLQTKGIIEGGEKLAAGDLSHKVDTENLKGDFKRHGESLNRVNEGIKNAVDEKLKSERMKTELITNVSHDIKTPLTSIINYVDLLSKENIEDENTKEYIEVLERQAKRLKKLIDDLIDASKASTGNVKLEMEEINPALLLQQAAVEYNDKLEKNNIKLIVKVPQNDILVRADGRQLWRIYDNLLNNIYKYAANNTRAYAEVSQTSEAIVISFKNISKEELDGLTGDELMERFVRADKSRNTEGSGLGLSIVKSLSQLMYADFSVSVDGDLFKAVLKFNSI